ncbi:tetratricopeptide repeat protein [Planktothrix sp. FACHB-1355]|uniref:Tetratricopeptide repeat protein n=1 Tax=Aerosakkonema funiforme FACHB-1375 TaxID=2949571 RepID=A0A926VDT2_9CYAN|nr:MULTISPECIES: tetratricopeptide repeat protein [Oscillatoriales]MBD2181976.1 tetratricopeptide repeat protein [Aerosakkonema funiforme FACHB-1375]MBD3559136.1 tetratricopeptide repeat protein [Planktothrix sp. FACHB-1355]
MEDYAEESKSAMDEAIAHYQEALSTIEKAGSILSKRKIIEMLLSRDGVENLKNNGAELNTSQCALLIDLDERLKELAGIIAKKFPLASYRLSVNPPESSWWWFLESFVPREVHKHDRFDWVWYGLTLGCMVVATTFGSSTAQAFSSEGFDILGTFSTVGQAVGMLLLAGGVLTENGKETVENALKSVGIPPHFHAEAIFGASALMAASTYVVYANLPTIGEYYYKQGQISSTQGDVVSALDLYKRALNFNPNDSKIYVALGKVSEDMGQLKEAISYYEKGRSFNDPAALNGLGRVLVFQSLEDVGWTAKIDEKVERRADFFLVAAEKLVKEEQKLLRRDIAINHGILYLSDFDLKKSSVEDANNALDNAYNSFEQAAELEKTLPKETKEQNKGQCYLQITEKIRQEVNYQKGQFLNSDIPKKAEACYGELYRAGLNPYDDTKIYYSLYTSRVSLEAYKKPENQKYRR